MNGVQICFFLTEVTLEIKRSDVDVFCEIKAFTSRTDVEVDPDTIILAKTWATVKYQYTHIRSFLNNE